MTAIWITVIWSQLLMLSSFFAPLWGTILGVTAVSNDKSMQLLALATGIILIVIFSKFRKK